MLGGGILFGAIIGETIRIVEGRNPQAQLIKEKLNDLKGYLAEKPLSMGLKKDIKVAYTYYLQKKTSFGDQLFKELPFNLLEKLVYKMFEREIACIELLQSSDKLFVIRLVQFCQPLYCAIGDILYDCGDVTNEFVFIMKGLVSISTVQTKTVNILAGYATEGHFCMDFEYLMNTLSLARYQVAEQSNIFVIKYTVIADACSDFVESSLNFREELVRRYKNFKEVLALDFEATRTHVQKKFLSNQSPKFQTEYRRPVFWIDGFQRDSFDRHQSNVEFSIFDEKGYGDIRVLVKTSDATFQITKVSKQSLIKKLIVNPDGRVKLRWDILIIIFILYSVLYIPVQLAFDTPSSQGLNIFNDIVDAVFVSDIFISSRTAYYDDLEDAYMIEPKSIYNRYMKTWFLVDFFSGVPFDSIVKAVVDVAASNLLSIRLIKVIRLMRLLKLARLLKLSKYIYKIEDALDITPALFELLVLMLRVLFLGHFLACIWWGLTTVLSNDPWYKETEFQPQGATFMDCGTDEKYVASLYWTFTTLATVGYGDFVSVNTYERLLNIFIMLIGATTFGYIVANVSSTFGSLNQSQTLKREKIGAISSILSEKNISENLSASIINHFKNVYSKVSMYDEETILIGLPNRLNNRIATAIYKDTMQKINIFKFIDNQSVALYIFNILQPLNFQYGQVILKEDTASLEICFLLSGEAVVCKQLKGSKMQNYLFNWNTNLTKKLNPTRLEPIKNLSQEQELKLKRGRDIAMSVKKTRFQKGNSESKYSVIDDSVKTALDTETEPDEMVLDDKLRTSNLHLSRNDSENNITRGSESFLDDKSNSSTFDTESDHENKSSFFSSINSNSDSTSANLFLTDDDIIKLGYEPLARYGSGDFFGHSSFLKEINYNASVVALSSCSTYSLQKSELVKLVIASPPIAMILQSAIGKAIHALFRSRGKEEVSKKRASFLTTIKLRHVLHRHQRKLKEEKLKKELYSKKKSSIGLEPLNHTLRRLSLRQVIVPITTTFKSSKWDIVRKAVRDAKVSSIVATMVDGVKKHPSGVKKASDHFRMALNKSFGVSLEAVLNESAIHYDSESSYEDEDEINASEKYKINNDGKNERPINLKRIKKKALIRRCHSFSIIGNTFKSDTEDDVFNIISESENIKRRRASFPSSSQHFKQWKKCRIDNVV